MVAARPVERSGRSTVLVNPPFQSSAVMWGTNRSRHLGEAPAIGQAVGHSGDLLARASPHISSRAASFLSALFQVPRDGRKGSSFYDLEPV